MQKSIRLIVAKPTLVSIDIYPEECADIYFFIVKFAFVNVAEMIRLFNA